MGLELYAKIEPLLGFDKEIQSLYDLYIQILRSWKPESIIDIGCGSGKFLSYVKQELPIQKSFGVDLSETMIARAKAEGLDVEVADICSINRRFDTATAIFDVLNYLDSAELQRFLGCVETLLEPGGVFLADINTLFGFEEVAPGSLVRRDEKTFLVLESVFENGWLKTYIDYFEKDDRGSYNKEEDIVVQRFHSIESVVNSTTLELIQVYPVSLYADEPDKEILLFQKRG